MAKRNKYFFVMIPLICSFGLNLVSCAEPIKQNKEGDSPVGAVDFISDSDNTNKSPSNSNADFKEIEGLWNSPCEQGAVEFVQRHINFSNGNFRQENQFHPDANCVNKFKSPVVIEGTFEIGDSFTTSTGLFSKKIDIIIPESGGELRTLNIVYIDSNGNLYFGDENTTGERPVTLDLNFAYIK